MPTEKPRDDEERAEQPTPAEPPPQPPVPIREFGGQSGEETEDERLLQRDSQRTGPETTTDAWRVFRIIGEFVEGFETLAESCFTACYAGWITWRKQVAGGLACGRQRSMAEAWLADRRHRVVCCRQPSTSFRHVSHWQ